MKNFYLLKTTCFSTLTLLFLVALAGKSTAQSSMRATLYAITTAGPVVVDGNLTQYSDTYSNNIDGNDILKMVNPGINFSILRSTSNLVVEKRNMYSNTDTTFFRMWNMPRQHYRIKFISNGMDDTGFRGYIKDNYLNTETSIVLNDTTDIDFIVDINPLSSDEMRFELVYARHVVVPDTLTLPDGVTVYPNPVTNKTVQIHFSNQIAGKYNLTLIHLDGRQQQLAALEVSAGQQTYPVNLPQLLATGIYRLQMHGPGNTVISKAIEIRR